MARMSKKDLEAIVEAQNGWRSGKIPAKRYIFRITTIAQMLGTAPDDKDIYRNFVGNGTTEERLQEELESLGPYPHAKDNKNRKKPEPVLYQDGNEVDEDEESYGEVEVDTKGITVFRRNKNGDPVICDHMVKGFFKNSCKALKQVPGTLSSEKDTAKSYRTKIDNLVFVYPRFIKINNLNKDQDITLMQRPLRIQDRNGERVALACSECIPEGVTMTFVVDCLTDEMYNLIPELMDYGRLNGIGQWHNSDKGSFVWEMLDTNGNVIGGNKCQYDEMQSFLDMVETFA